MAGMHLQVGQQSILYEESSSLEFVPSRDESALIQQLLGEDVSVPTRCLMSVRVIHLTVSGKHGLVGGQLFEFDYFNFWHI